MSFPNADSIEFSFCSFDDWDEKQAIKLNIQNLKCIVLSNCWFQNTKLFKKIFIDSGLAYKLESLYILDATGPSINDIKKLMKDAGLENNFMEKSD